MTHSAFDEKSGKTDLLDVVLNLDLGLHEIIDNVFSSRKLLCVGKGGPATIISIVNRRRGATKD